MPLRARRDGEAVPVAAPVDVRRTAAGGQVRNLVLPASKDANHRPGDAMESIDGCHRAGGKGTRPGSGRPGWALDAQRRAAVDLLVVHDAAIGSAAGIGHEPGRERRLGGVTGEAAAGRGTALAAGRPMHAEVVPGRDGCLGVLVRDGHAVDVGRPATHVLEVRRRQGCGHPDRRGCAPDASREGHQARRDHRDEKGPQRKQGSSAS